MKMYIARDMDGDLYLYLNSKPSKKREIWLDDEDELLPISEQDLPEGCNPKWEDDEPIEVELTINLKKG